MTTQRSYSRRYFPPPYSRASTSKDCPLPATDFRPAFQWLAGMTSLTIVAALLIAILSALPALAQQGIHAAGDAIMTGFSGAKPPQGALPPGRSPMDETFIDLNGDVMRIFRRPSPPALEAQLVQAQPAFTLKARDIGQVFAIALEERDNGPPPSIYLGATSAFGIQIVRPDDDGDGRPERIERGAPDAQFMPGQFGADKGGGPGAIWRVDGQTGAATLFANPANSGPGIGDIVHDRATRQFFASDLDSGLIHRIDASGAVLDSFDHGTMARPAVGLPPLPDDGARMDITNPAFIAHDAKTWGFTQPERLVWGMALRGGRLYYAVTGGLEVWSVGILLDGGFANDARLEFSAHTQTSQPISDMAFDASGRLYLAQRGEPRGNYDYMVLAEPAQGVVQRYRREFPDDPGTRGTWIAQPEEYAAGLPEGHRKASGGLALGNDPAGLCDGRVWATGDALRGWWPGVDGLQVSPADSPRPKNEPPFQSFFLDYDGQPGDGGESGHVGDVEIWQPCRASFGGSAILPYGETPAGYAPPAYDPFNLRLTKRARARDCVATNGGFLCQYIARVTNTGPGAYFGPVTVYELLPGAPAGAAMSFNPQPPWTCKALAAHEHECSYPPVLLFPGESIELPVSVKLPGGFAQCRLENVAALSWPFGSGDANADDDIDWAHGRVPSRNCPSPQGARANLRIDKHAAPPACWTVPEAVRCGYLVKVTNTGPGVYDGPIRIADTVLDGTATFTGPSWTCTSGPTHVCTYAATTLDPGESIFLPVRVDVPRLHAREKGCRLRNRVKISDAAGSSDRNSKPADDDDEAVAVIVGRDCEGTRANLRLEKRIDDKGCRRGEGHVQCGYTVRLVNAGPGPYSGPVAVRETIPAEAKAVFGDGWTCAGRAAHHLCARTVSLPKPGDAAVLSVRITIPDDMAAGLQCRAASETRLLFPPGGSPANIGKGDDQASAAADLPAELCPGVAVEPTPSCPSGFRRENGQCVRSVTLLPVPADGCRRGFWRSEGRCCPLGQVWNGKRCAEGPPPAEGPRCPPGVTGVYPDCVVVEMSHCPPPTRFVNGRCVEPAGADDNRCGRGRYLSDGHCCPRGTVWNGKRCRRNPSLQPRCPPGTTGAFPNCRTPVELPCPPGTEGLSPDCAPTRACPPGTAGLYPNCWPFQAARCPPGTRGAYPNCIPTARNCPPGFAGVPPVCRPLGGRPCPPGSVGSGGRCVLLQLQRRAPIPRQPGPSYRPPLRRGNILR